MRIRTKILVWFLVLGLVPLILAGVAFFLIGRTTLEDQALKHLQSTAQLQKQRVEVIVKHDLEMLSFTQNRSPIRQALGEQVTSPTASTLQALNTTLSDELGSNPDFKKITVLNADGTAIASTDPSSIGKNFSNTTYFQQGKDRVSLGSFFVGPDGHLEEYLTGPVTVDGEKLGVIAIESDADSFTDLMSDRTGLGKTGETVVGEKTPEGNAVFLGPVRFGSSKLLGTVVAGQKANVPINIAVSGKAETLSNSVDYRGTPVLAATQFVSNPPLGIVVKVDKSEAFAPVYNMLLVLVIVLACVAIIIVIVSYPLARSITRPLLFLTRDAQAISAGDLSRRSDIETGDEIGTLAKAFNEMSDELAEEREHLETKVAERTEELARSNQELAGYAHTVSHDLRGPMASIEIGGSLLEGMLEEESQSSEEMAEVLKQIRRSTDRSFSLINDLLALAEAGERPMQVEPVDIDDTVRLVLQERSPKIREKNAHVEVAEGLGTVIANPTHIYQLFSNLIVNGIKHNASPNPVVEVRRTGGAGSGGGTYEVRDNGPGIPEEELPRVFEPFFKGTGSGETGIGLATVEKIVNLYGGTVTARNIEGGGAAFEFTLSDYRGERPEPEPPADAAD